MFVETKKERINIRPVHLKIHYVKFSLLQKNAIYLNGIGQEVHCTVVRVYSRLNFFSCFETCGLATKARFGKPMDSSYFLPMHRCGQSMFSAWRNLIFDLT